MGRATQAYQRATDFFDDVVGQRLGLNATDLRALDWLSEGPMAAGELGRATGLSSAATTALVDRLQAKGHVRRVTDGSDRRKVVVELSDDGRRILGKLYGPLADEGSRLLERFSDAELESLRGFLLEATAVVDRQRERLQAGDESS